MIFDVTIVIALEHHRPCPYKMVKLIVNKCFVCSDCSTNQPFLHLSHSTQASLFPERQKFEIKTINKLTMASKCSSKRKNHSFLSRGSSQSRELQADSLQSELPGKLPGGVKLHTLLILNQKLEMIKHIDSNFKILLTLCHPRARVETYNEINVVFNFNFFCTFNLFFS